MISIPTLMSKKNKANVITIVEKIPSVTNITTRVDTPERLSMVFVVTDVIAPRLFLLKYPIGR